MREILFRGKDSSGVTNHSWHFGSLDSQEDDCSVIIFYDRFGNKCRINVDSDTVGQYTGLIDRTGKRIFEGDILKADNGHIGFVAFIRGIFVKCCFCHAGSINDIHGDNETIIGNIYDNPELLRSGKYMRDIDCFIEYLKLNQVSKYAFECI